MKYHRSYVVYILRCSDGTYYTGMTNNIDRRFAEHKTGAHKASYTFKRRPVQLLWAEQFRYVRDAIAWEKRIRKWSAAKKRALIESDWARLKELAQCKNGSVWTRERNGEV